MAALGGVAGIATTAQKSPRAALSRRQSAGASNGGFNSTELGVIIFGAIVGCIIIAVVAAILILRRRRRRQREQRAALRPAMSMKPSAVTLLQQEGVITALPVLPFVEHRKPSSGASSPRLAGRPASMDALNRMPAPGILPNAYTARSGSAADLWATTLGGSPKIGSPKIGSPKIGSPKVPAVTTTKPQTPVSEKSAWSSKDASSPTVKDLGAGGDSPRTARLPRNRRMASTNNLQVKAAAAQPAPSGLRLSLRKNKKQNRPRALRLPYAPSSTAASELGDRDLGDLEPADRWSWTNSQAPATPRMTAWDQRFSVASLVSLPRSLAGWLAAQRENGAAGLDEGEERDLEAGWESREDVPPVPTGHPLLVLAQQQQLEIDIEREMREREMRDGNALGISTPVSMEDGRHEGKGSATVTMSKRSAELEERMRRDDSA